MSDEAAGATGTPREPGAVARLTAALAEAQAAARAGAADLDGDAAHAVTDEPVRSPDRPGRDDAADHPAVDGAEVAASEDPLRARIGALPLLADETDRGVTLDPAPPALGAVAAVSVASPQPESVPSSDESSGPPRPRRLWPLYAAMGLLIVAVPALVWTGYRIASNSTAGEVLSGRSNPSSPGYTALVDPTPTALIIQVSNSGHAQGLTVLSLSGPNQKGGAVVVSPVEVRLTKPRLGIESFSGIVDVNSTDTAGKVIGSELGLGFTQVVKVTDADLTRLVAPVAPLEIDNPEPVTRLDGSVFDAGPIELAADEVPTYLTAEDEGHTLSGKLARQQLVWEAWIKAIADGGPRAVPGETDVGIGQFLVGLAAGTVQSTSFPVSAAPDVDGRPAVRIDHDPAMLLIANAVPFPIGSIPGDRATVVVLNGTGPGSPPASVLQRLVVGGAQITSMGNAKRFDHAGTVLTYTDARARPFALAMAERLGVGRVVHSNAADNGVDVSVVMGRDLLSNPPGPLTIEEVESNP